IQKLTKSAIKILLLLTVHCSLTTAHAQRSTGINNQNPNEKASLDVGVTTGFKQGFFMPRLATADTNNIGVTVGKDKGLMFYDTLIGQIRHWDGAKWQSASLQSTIATQQAAINLLK